MKDTARNRFVYWLNCGFKPQTAASTPAQRRIHKLIESMPKQTQANTLPRQNRIYRIYPGGTYPLRFAFCTLWGNGQAHYIYVVNECKEYGDGLIFFFTKLKSIHPTNKGSHVRFMVGVLCRHVFAHPDGGWLGIRNRTMWRICFNTPSSRERKHVNI